MTCRKPDTFLLAATFAASFAAAICIAGSSSKLNLICGYSISQDSMIFLVLPYMVKFLVTAAVFPEYKPSR